MATDFRSASDKTGVNVIMSWPAVPRPIRSCAAASRKMRSTWARETENRRASSGDRHLHRSPSGGIVSSSAPASVRLDRIMSPALCSAKGRSVGVTASVRMPVRN